MERQITSILVSPTFQMSAILNTPVSHTHLNMYMHIKYMYFNDSVQLQNFSIWESK